MTVYAQVTSGYVPSYLTLHKLYPIHDESPKAFYISDDTGEELCCLWKGCAHLDDGDWERVEDHEV